MVHSGQQNGLYELREGFSNRQNTVVGGSGEVNDVKESAPISSGEIQARQLCLNPKCKRVAEAVVTRNYNGVLRVGQTRASSSFHVLAGRLMIKVRTEQSHCASSQGGAPAPMHGQLRVGSKPSTCTWEIDKVIGCSSDTDNEASGQAVIDRDVLHEDPHR